MDLRRLRYFATVLDTGSFSQAAEKLCIVQSALSTQIRKLEQEVGAPVFVRDARGVRPTDIGKRLLMHARLILDQVAEAERDLKNSTSAPRGISRIGIPSSVSRVLTLPLLQAVERALPEVTLHIAEAMTEDLQDWLDDGNLDIGIVYRLKDEPGFDRAEILRSEPLYLVSAATASLSAPGSTISATALATVDLILPTERHRIRRQVDRLARELAFTPRIKHELDSLPQTLRLVAENRGHGVMILSSFLSEWQSGRLFAQRITDMGPEGKLMIEVSPVSNSATAAGISKLVTATTRRLAQSGAWPAAI